MANPTSDATVSLTAFNVVTDMRDVSAPAEGLFQPIPAGRESFNVPVFAFLVEHVTTGRRIMFDLGPRKDQENSAPPFPEMIKAGLFTMPVDRDITEQLVDNGVDLKSISAVIWSHTHFDHTGDISKFPASTELVFGPATSTVTHLEDPESHLVDSDINGRKMVHLNLDERPLEIGGFKAHNYFEDGSFYVLDVPGHRAGHICALARVTPTTFVFLGADSCHHPGMLRPTAKLHRHFPCPGELLAAARRSVSTTHFPPPDAAGDFDLAARTKPMLDVAEDGIYEDKPTVRASITKMGDFDANKDVFVFLAHDESLVDIVGPFPVLVNDWKAKGWKDRSTWVFIDEANPAFRFNDKV
ncbi:hypothetical protein B0H14DRAFT_2938448 [Mycena olivaceomarginata]|nr:hypothetical protein B0H14DRAFT_2938448 [Mycena olivaceomarginata]